MRKCTNTRFSRPRFVVRNNAKPRTKRHSSSIPLGSGAEVEIDLSAIEDCLLQLKELIASQPQLEGIALIGYCDPVSGELTGFAGQIFDEETSTATPIYFDTSLTQTDEAPSGEPCPMGDVELKTLFNLVKCDADGNKYFGTVCALFINGVQQSVTEFRRLPDGTIVEEEPKGLGECPECPVPVPLNCEEINERCVVYDNGVSPGSSSNNGGLRPNFVSKNWTMKLKEFNVNGTNVADGRTVGPFVTWNDQLTGRNTFINELNPDKKANAQSQFFPAPKRRTSKVTTYDPDVEYGTIVLERDDGVIFTVYPVCPSEKKTRIYSYLTLDCKTGEKTPNYCIRTEDGLYKDLEEAPENISCSVPCGYKYSNIIASSSECEESTFENICTNDEASTPLIALVTKCPNGEISTLVVTLDSYLNASTPDDLVEYTGEIKNCTTGEVLDFSNCGLAPYTKICFLEENTTECASEQTIPDADYTSASSRVVGRPANGLRELIDNRDPQNQVTVASGANFNAFVADLESKGYTERSFGETHYICPCPPGLVSAGDYFTQMDGNTVKKMFCEPLAEIPQAPTKVVEQAKRALLTLGKLDDLILAKLCGIETKLCDMLATQIDCEQGGSNGTSFTHTTLNNTTDIVRSYNGTTLKIDKTNQPFNSPTAQPFLDAIASCIEQGGSAVIDFTDPDGNKGQFTATAVTGTSATQNTYSGTGDIAQTQSGKVVTATTTCTLISGTVKADLVLEKNSEAILGKLCLIEEKLRKQPYKVLELCEKISSDNCVIDEPKIYSPTAIVSDNLPPFNPNTPIGNHIDKSGLSPTFADGDDFVSYMTQTHVPQWNGNETYVSGTAPRVVVYDMGQGFTISDVAIWSEEAHGPANVVLEISTDGINFVPLLSGGLPNNAGGTAYLPTRITAECARFGQYIRATYTGHTGSANIYALGEIAFGGVIGVVEGDVQYVEFLRNFTCDGITNTTLLGTPYQVIDEANVTKCANQELIYLQSMQSKLCSIQANTTPSKNIPCVEKFSGNQVQQLSVPAGSLGKLVAIEDSGAGLVYFTIDGTNPSNAPGPNKGEVTGPYHQGMNLENVDLSLLRFDGSSTGSDYTVYYEKYLP